ncbi:MAG: branched-chain amino acid ABC transporter permease, partial [Proteobacteria bacterium]|nr:branched-chain amino acid ABC transporter permease [Pseudomonadota bacterium]
QGLAVLGVVLLTRGGGATFGQGMFFALGAYVAALLPTYVGISDAFVRGAAGMVVAGLGAAILAPLLARYQGIFFAMLTLALSMVLYGLLSKSDALGGSDGMSVVRATFATVAVPAERTDYVMYALAVTVCSLAGWLVSVHWRSSAGLIAQAVRANPLRVEYLGASARFSLGQSFVLSAMLAGLGGALAALALGHVEPNMTNWTTSGEFVFVAVLAGHASVAAVFLSSFLLEVVRSFSNLYFPNTWQLALGCFLLVVIVVRPDGLGSLWRPRKTASDARGADARTAGGTP